MKRLKKQKKRGFTLIELLLVLVILAALATIVVPKFTGKSKQAKITTARTTISNFETALEAFEINCGRYPTNTEGLRVLIEQPSNAVGWEGPYLRKNAIPKDPWGNDFVYRYPGQYNRYGYDLYSYGPDGQQGSEDDITNWSEEITG